MCTSDLPDAGNLSSFGTDCHIASRIPHLRGTYARYSFLAPSLAVRGPSETEVFRVAIAVLVNPIHALLLLMMMRHEFATCVWLTLVATLVPCNGQTMSWQTIGAAAFSGGVALYPSIAIDSSVLRPYT